MEKPRVRVTVAEVERDGRYLLTQRREEAVMPLLWEFPGGRVAPGETDREALERSLLIRLGVEIEVGELALETEHEYDEYVVVLASYRVSLRGEPEDRRVRAHRWVHPGEFDQYTFPGADQGTVDALLRAPV